jgi:hypothetical protein
MELASMLAGEPFSDHPESACPVIASFLRAYNDSIDADRRQDVYAYASRVVGSSYEVQRARAERLAAWTQQRHRHWWTRFLHPSALLSAVHPGHEHDAAATRAIQAISPNVDEAHQLGGRRPQHEAGGGVERRALATLPMGSCGGALRVPNRVGEMAAVPVAHVVWRAGCARVGIAPAHTHSRNEHDRGRGGQGRCRCSPIAGLPVESASAWALARFRVRAWLATAT